VLAYASSRETIEEIRQKAPQQYYTQDRMVTGEDYNILPYTLFSNVLKVKAVNRTSSGVSRYLDVIDTTGKYSSTNIFCQDGILYRDNFIKSFSFDYATKNDIYKVILNQIKPLAAEKETTQFFYSNYTLIALSNMYWNYSTSVTNGSTGYLYDNSGATGTLPGKVLAIADFGSGANKFIKQKSIIKFSAGEGNYFDSRNQIKSGTPTKPGDKYFVYATIERIVGDGTNGGLGNLINGDGPVTINQNLPSGAIAIAVYPVFNNDFSTALIEQIVSYIQAYEDFGLRYDVEASEWKLILPGDLNPTDDFGLLYAGNTSSSGIDASWLIRLKTVGQTYTVLYRGLNYVFESVQETNFYFDDRVKVYDPSTGFTIYDQVKVLKVNSQPDSAEPLALDYTWYIYKNIVEVDGYEVPNRILVTFPDSDNDGVPDNPELFEILISPGVNASDKYVYFRATTGYDNFVLQESVDSNLVESRYSNYVDVEFYKTLYQDGQLFYIPSVNEFYKLSVTGSTYTLTKQDGSNGTDSYTAKVGRQDLYFQYRHNSPNYRRIDPSPNNIVDLYILTKQYATDYTAWIQDTSGKVIEPTIPTSEDLNIEFNSLENYKSISDSIIYNPVKFKPIFGAKADAALQATFKVIKNPNVVVSDSDVKTSVIAAINTYFALANWDFGETFYFSELSAYLHNTLAPNIASVVIVPASESSAFGSLMQINAEYNEIIVSAATVDNVQIISAITAAQINQTVLA